MACDVLSVVCLRDTTGLRPAMLFQELANVANLHNAPKVMVFKRI